MMQYIPNNNTSLEKEKINLRLLEELLIKDKNRNDLKSYGYHKMAYDGTLKRIKKLEEVQ